MKFFRWCFLLAPMSVVFTSQTLANEDWWFDVEVIAFKRNVSLSELEEQFTLAASLEASRSDADLIGAVIAPDISYPKQGLPRCGEDTTIPLPARELIEVPASDVDFLSLPPLVSSETPLSMEKQSVSMVASATVDAQDSSKDDIALRQNSNDAFEREASETAALNSVEAELEPNSALNTVLNENTVDEELQAPIPPSASEIASLWLSFFGVNAPSPLTDISKAGEETPNTIRPIQVPSFKVCETIKPWMDVETFDGQLVVTSHTPDNRLPSPARLPIIVEGHDWPLSPKAHLLSSEQHALTSISKQIRSNRELERIFHVTWRQPVLFGKDNAFDVRLFGGKNYASEFDASGELLQHTVPVMHDNSTASGDQTRLQREGVSFESASVDSEQEVIDESDILLGNAEVSTMLPDFFEQLEDRLANATPIALREFAALDSPTMNSESNAENSFALRPPIWEIDGTMKVFLKYINRVPYLHIDSALFYRQPVEKSYFTVDQMIENTPSTVSASASSPDASISAPMRLVAVPLKEQRRVISTQLHYFDHPLFGFVVQIRRYNRPEIEVSEED